MESRDVKKLKQDIEFEARIEGVSLHFKTTWGIFSPREIDEGSRLLLEHVVLPQGADICDIGCGYGALGLFLAARDASSHVTMVDTDFVAVEYAKKNAVGNDIQNCEIYLSNGFSAIPKEKKFDAVVCNVPAKVGREMLWILLHDAKEHLKEGGIVYVVTINGLREFIKKNFKDIFGNYDKVKQGRAYTVASAAQYENERSGTQQDSEL